MGKHKNRFEFRSTDLVAFIWEKRKFLFSVTAIAAVFSFIVSLLITPLYLSTVVMFPASSASVSKSLLATNSNSREDLLKFGGEEEGEQLMQVLFSADIRDQVIKKFNLSRHYKVDTTKKYWRTKIFNQYKENITFHRTEYMSVVVEVLDADPDTAALIANEISSQVDSVMSRIQHERASKAFEIVKTEYLNLEMQIKDLQDSLKHLQDFGVIDYKSQMKAFSNAQVKAMESGNSNAARQIERKVSELSKFGEAYLVIHDLLENETTRFSELKAKYMEAKVDAEQVIPHKFVVDKAYKAEKKAYPKKLLIVLISSIAAFFTALLGLVFVESIHLKVKD